MIVTDDHDATIWSITQHYDNAYKDLTYNDFTSNINKCRINKCDITYAFIYCYK